MTSLVVRSTSPARRCAACHDDLGPVRAAARWTCGGCGTAVHRACLPGLRRCPTLGCRRPLGGGAAPIASVRRAHRATNDGPLTALVVATPALLGALWPALLWLVSALVTGFCGALHLPSAALLPLCWLSVLLAPLGVGLGFLAPMARERGLPGRHELRAGLGALAGYGVGSVGLVVVLLRTFVKC